MGQYIFVKKLEFAAIDKYHLHKSKQSHRRIKDNEILLSL
jgi:hypothetical protein